jgi:hypothetical protein
MERAIELGLLCTTIDGMAGCAECWSDRLCGMKRTKKPKKPKKPDKPDKRPLHSAIGGSVIAVGVGGLFGIPGILASLNTSNHHYHWAWPTNWMVVPIAFIVIGFALLVVPLRRVVTPEPAPFESGTGKYSITLISTELKQWKTFFSTVTEKGWISLSDFDNMSAADGLVGDDGSDRFALPKSLKVNLLTIYRYLTALIDARDSIKRWQGSSEPITLNKTRSEDSGIGDIVGGAVGSVIGALGVFGFQYAALGRKVKNKQVKDREYQERLKALPDILSALRENLEVVRAGGKVDDKIQPSIELPKMPVVEVNHRSIDFELVPVKSYDISAAQ